LCFAMLGPLHLVGQIRIGVLFARSRVLKLVFRSRVFQVFLLLVFMLLGARYAYSPFALFILSNPYLCRVISRLWGCFGPFLMFIYTSLI